MSYDICNGCHCPTFRCECHKRTMTKAQRRDYEQKWTDLGLPIEANDWTEDDWLSLHRAIEQVKAEVAARHKAEREGK